MNIQLDRIPQAAPREGYLACQDRINAAIKSVMMSGFYILGSEVRAFEEEFASYLGSGTAVGVGNGTDAIELALRACGVKEGDHVVTVSLTAVATVSAIRKCGGIPVLVDINPETYTMDPDSLSVCLASLDRNGKRPKAIVPVHLYGCPAEMASITEMAARFEIPIVEDCAQAHGAEYRGRKVGAIGLLGAFSFYPTKNLGAFGDGGAVVTHHSGMAEEVRLLRQYGWRERYVSDKEGANSRLDEIQAAILRVKLRDLNNDNDARRHIAGIYSTHLQECGIPIPVEPPHCKHVYHQYVIRVPRQDKFRTLLSESGIDTAIHYPLAVHQQAPYREFGRIVSLVNTERAIHEIVSLPMYPQLGSDRAVRVCEAVTQALKCIR